jgi:hypothetical protein
MPQKLTTTFTILILVLLMIGGLMLVSSFSASLPDTISQHEAQGFVQSALVLVS